MNNNYDSSPDDFNAVSVGQVLPDALALLEKGKKDVQAALRFAAHPAAIRQHALETVRKISRKVPSDSRDLDLLAQLSDANAVVVATYSASGTEQFPREVPVDALLPLANLYGSLGREHEARTQFDEALERYIAGLGILTTLRMHRPWFTVDKVAFWLMLRTAGSVGYLAAGKGMSARQTLMVFGNNMERFFPLLGGGDVTVHRGACLVAYARRKVALGIDREEIDVLREELSQLAGGLEFYWPDSAARFYRDFEAIIGQMDQLQSDSNLPAFSWS